MISKLKIAFIFITLTGLVACQKEEKNKFPQGLDGNWTPLTMSVSGSPATTLSLVAKSSVVQFKDGVRTLQLQNSVDPGKCKDADGLPGLEDSISARESRCIHKAAITKYTLGEDREGTFVILEDPTTNSPLVVPFNKKVYYKVTAGGTRLETRERNNSGLIRIITWKRKTVKR